MVLPLDSLLPLNAYYALSFLLVEIRVFDLQYADHGLLPTGLYSKICLTYSDNFRWVCVLHNEITRTS